MLQSDGQPFWVVSLIMVVTVILSVLMATLSHWDGWPIIRINKQGVGRNTVLQGPVLPIWDFPPCWEPVPPPFIFFYSGVPKSTTDFVYGEFSVEDRIRQNWFRVDILEYPQLCSHSHPCFSLLEQNWIVKLLTTINKIELL